MPQRSESDRSEETRREEDRGDEQRGQAEGTENKQAAGAKQKSRRRGTRVIPPRVGLQVAAAAASAASAASGDGGGNNKKAVIKRMMDRLTLLNSEKLVATHQLVKVMTSLILRTFVVPANSELTGCVRTAMKEYHDKTHGQAGHGLGSPEYNLCG